MITLIGVLANADEWNQIAAFAAAKEEWLKIFLKLPNRIPSHDRIQRVMSMIDESVLYRLSIQFLLERIDKSYGDRAAAQGRTGRGYGGRSAGNSGDRRKTSRGSKRNKVDREATAAMHRASAFSTERGLGLSEVVVDQKSIEIPAVRRFAGYNGHPGLYCHVGRDEYLKRDGAGINCEEGGIIRANALKFWW
jgi:hypothetical protein